MGAEGSGNFGHAGRPGEIGGSLGAGQSVAIKKFGPVRGEHESVDDFQRRTKTLGGNYEGDLRLGRNSDHDAATSTALHKALLEKGGFSVDIKTGKSPKDGFMTATDKSTEAKYPKDFSPQDILDYADKHHVELSRDNAHLGGWKDAKGVPTLDVSTRFDTKQKAMNAGRAAQQDAIYDVAKGEEVKITHRVSLNAKSTFQKMHFKK